MKNPVKKIAVNGWTKLLEIDAIKYVNQSLKSKINYGKGHGPVNHLNSFTLESKFK